MPRQRSQRLWIISGRRPQKRLASVAVLEASTCLSDEQWRAIQDHERRLARALEQRDYSQAVGSAKELCETVARLVLEARAETFTGHDYGPLIGRAHAALKRQPGVGVAADRMVRDMAGAARTLATQLGDLRNGWGTGHGRSRAPDTLEEHSFLAAEAALLWARWALRRLDHLVMGRPADLIRDLAGGFTFYSGDLRRRMAAANIPELNEEEAHALGMAVGQRAARGTFLAAIEGIDEPLAADDPWPASYRRGVLQGLVVDADGRISLRVGGLTRFARLVSSLDAEAIETLDLLTEQLSGAEWSYRVSTDERTEIAVAFDEACYDADDSVAMALHRVKKALVTNL